MIELRHLRRAVARTWTWVGERVRPGDAGTSLMELIVGMAIMVVFMGMFTGAMLVMSTTANKVEAVTATTMQSTDGFLRLDREIRYASAISTPAYDSTAKMWHVEFASTILTQSTNSVSAPTVCTQLAVDPSSGSGPNPGQLKQRTWTVGGSKPSAWTPIENNISNTAATDSPFPTTTSVAGGTASTTMQQLTISLNVATTAPGSASSMSSYTFTALNSSTTNPNTSSCQQFAVGATS